MTEDKMTEMPRLLGCPCVPLAGQNHAIQTLGELVARGIGGYTVAINAEKIMFYGSRADLREVIDNALLPYPDGVGAVFALRLLHEINAQKIDMPTAAINGAALKGWRVFILGASEEINLRATEEIQRRHPQIQIVGRLNGYEADEIVTQAIRSAQPDVVLAALGSPRQELFAARLTAVLPGILVVGCGGALDIISGAKQRAPAFMVNGGLEWLYRLVKEPKRWRRQMVLPVFFVRLLAEAARIRFRRRS